jgi:hypothetical protein
MVEALRLWYVSRRSASAEQPLVRPWGLATPILVLVVCLPLLRPLRHPVNISENEKARLATIQAVAERQTLAIDETAFAATQDRIRTSRDGTVRHYSEQGPVMAVLLSGPYWIMNRLGAGFDVNPSLSVYLLTMLGCTLPVAGAAGLAYRLGRVFELRRPWRMTLAIACVFGTGLISYATVLNSHAPAAALCLAAVTGIVQAATARSRGGAYGWLAGAGLCASFAAAIDFGAVAVLLLLAPVVLTLPRSAASRVFGLGFYALGSLPAIVLHAALTVPITGDLRPGFLHPELAAATATATVSGDPEEGEGSAQSSVMARVASNFADGVLGPHGMLSHFPVLLLGVAGVGMVLHRHWPDSTKALAVATLGAAVTVVGLYVTLLPGFNEPMFASRWFIPFLPPVLVWAGAWARRRHHPVIWAGAGCLLAFSVLTSLLGATDPFLAPTGGRHTAYVAAKQLMDRPSAPATLASSLAGAPGR